jgi:hypothetical protein
MRFGKFRRISFIFHHYEWSGGTEFGNYILNLFYLMVALNWGIERGMKVISSIAGAEWARTLRYAAEPRPYGSGSFWRRFVRETASGMK